MGQRRVHVRWLHDELVIVFAGLEESSIFVGRRTALAAVRTALDHYARRGANKGKAGPPPVLLSQSAATQIAALLATDDSRASRRAGERLLAAMREARFGGHVKTANPKAATRDRRVRRGDAGQLDN